MSENDPNKYDEYDGDAEYDKSGKSHRTKSNDVPFHPKMVNNPKVPKRNYALQPMATNQQILRTYFELRPTLKNDTQAIYKTANNLGSHPNTVADVIRDHFANEESKRQRREYADAIYQEKIPFAKELVGKGLEVLNQFICHNKPEDYRDASALSRIITDVSTLLRLELGQSTAQIEIIQKTEKDINVIVEELNNIDPFVDYKQPTAAPVTVKVKDPGIIEPEDINDDF